MATMPRAELMGALLSFFVRLITGAQGHRQGVKPPSEQRIHFANHHSHPHWVVPWDGLLRGLHRAVGPVPCGAPVCFAARVCFHAALRCFHA